jgi:hypothetical protein
VDYQKLSTDRLGESSNCIRIRVEATRQKERERYSDIRNSNIRYSSVRISDDLCNSDMRVGEVRQFCKLDEAGENLIHAAMGQMSLSARGYHRVLTLARKMHNTMSRTWRDANRYRPRIQQRLCSIDRVSVKAISGQLFAFRKKRHYLSKARRPYGRFVDSFGRPSPSERIDY